jgi:hypothetical protein
MGNFAQQIHPLTDSVELTIMRNNSGEIDIVTASLLLLHQFQSFVLNPSQLPYRSRFGSQSKNFTDAASYRANNCLATNYTNGFDIYGPSASSSLSSSEPNLRPITYAQQQPLLTPSDVRRHPVNVLLDATPLTDIDLPETMQPSNPALNQSYSVAQFYILDDNTTGVLALGSFSAPNFTAFQNSLLDGLVELKARGATKLIVDVVCRNLYNDC